MDLHHESNCISSCHDTRHPCFVSVDFPKLEGAQPKRAKVTIQLVRMLLITYADRHEIVLFPGCVSCTIGGSLRMRIELYAQRQTPGLFVHGSLSRAQILPSQSMLP